MKVRLAPLLLLLCFTSAIPADLEDLRWSRTIERVSSGVVSIQIDMARAFDTEWNSSSQATGFVVDAERGLILTNRHVVTPGPVTAQAVFQDREEVALYPVYRDPVHDFGFYRYDPAKLRFTKPAQLPLYPQGAQVGREIRVVGNDAGEQLSILAGTLARLDREAPDYGAGKYNDFNTFYYQAASGTSGGSSGSPVLDIQGRVVALNAGGSSAAASSFYLPLDRVVRALKLVQEGKPVARGTLQTVFSFTPFDELRRLGLRPTSEAAIRKNFPEQTGLLVVEESQRGSLSDGVLEPGDILLAVNNKLIRDFLSLEDILDEGVGQSVELWIERGGKSMKPTLNVQNLYDITPDKYLEFGEAVVHTLSWQAARQVNAPVRGVYVAAPGYVFNAAGVPRGAVITEVDGVQTDTVEQFEVKMSKLKDGEHARVRFYTMDDPRTTQWKVIRMDRRWFPARMCHRDDVDGVWPCKEWAPDGEADMPAPASTSFAKSNDSMINTLSPSLVLVNFDMPYSVSGITERNYFGTGVIVDAQRGYVIVDRNTVPVPLGDVRLTFAGTIEVPARVEYIHPLHNIAVLHYDPKLIGTTPARSAVLKTNDELEPGEQVWAVGLRADGKIQSRASAVGSIDPVVFPPSRSLQYRDANLETISLVNGPSDYDGVLVNQRGEVLASWASFAFDDPRDTPQQQNRGIAAELLLETLQLVRDDRPLYSLESEFVPVPLASARQLGLSEDWVRRIEIHSPGRRQVLGISRIVGGSAAAKLLRSGDIVLAIDGQTVNRFREVEHASQRASVRVTVLREGKEQVVEVPTAVLSGRDVDRIVLWAGAVLQAPHRAFAAQRGVEPEGVFVAYFAYGSPATRYQLWAGRRIVEVDGVPTPDLDAFLKAVSGREDRSSLRLRTLAWNDAVEVITIKLDRRYWPTYELRRTEQGWTRSPID